MILRMEWQTSGAVRAFVQGFGNFVFGWMIIAGAGRPRRWLFVPTRDYSLGLALPSTLRRNAGTRSLCHVVLEMRLCRCSFCAGTVIVEHDHKSGDTIERTWNSVLIPTSSKEYIALHGISPGYQVAGTAESPNSRDSPRSLCALHVR